MTAPKCQLSVITVVRNGASTIEKCLASVAAQAKFEDFIYEHVIIDGNSSDRTLEICRDFAVVVHGQKGTGIYNAMNQGVDVSAGEYVVFLNSDDWFDDGAVAAIRSKINSRSVDALFFSVNMVKDEVRTGRWDPTRTIGRRFAMPAPHPGMVMRRASFMDFGGFDESLRYSADYDLVLRLLRSGSYTVHSEALTNFALGGASSNRAAIKENGLVRKKNELSIFQRALGRFYDLR